MGLFQFLIVVQGIVAAALVGIILMQRSEGGGLGMGGGSPSGLMSARGAADFMTRTTTALATLFVLLSIGLAFVAAQQSGGSTLDDSLQRTEVPVVAPGAAAPAEGTDIPEAAAAPSAAPVPAIDENGLPIIPDDSVPLE